MPTTVEENSGSRLPQKRKITRYSALIGMLVAVAVTGELPFTVTIIAKISPPSAANRAWPTSCQGFYRLGTFAASSRFKDPEGHPRPTYHRDQDQDGLESV